MKNLLSFGTGVSAIFGAFCIVQSRAFLLSNTGSSSHTTSSVAFENSPDSRRRAFLAAGVSNGLVVSLSLSKATAMRGGAEFATFTSSAESVELGDVAVIGCGVLGTSFCRQLLDLERQGSPSLISSVTGVTRSISRHEAIASHMKNPEKLKLSTLEDVLSSGKKFKNIVFCAPPSGSEDYPGDIRQAITSLWEGAAGGGSFAFTSSGGIYGGGNGGTVTEDSPVNDSSPRSAKLIAAENECIGQSGTVLRLAGLYTLERGAHGYWFSDKMAGKEAQGPADGVINLLHYDDAAGACLAALLQGAKSGEDIHGKTFLISDGNPTTRQSICDSAMKHPLYASKPMPKFGAVSDKKGKIYDGSGSNASLKWTPQNVSFDEFMSTTTQGR
jgi:nucleoside-diphosphate-sugar epimerase